MPLPYENATSGERAVQDVQKILRAFGCDKFGHMTDARAGEVLLQFEYRGRQVSARASVNGYAQAWLKEHPYTSRTRGSLADHKRKADAIAQVAVYSILRDWIKGQIMAIETGVLSFEGAFLGQIMLPSGKTILEHATASNLLAAPVPTAADCTSVCDAYAAENQQFSDELARLRAENERLKADAADAARYRWIKRGASFREERDMGPGRCWSIFVAVPRRPAVNSLDTAIDAAMAQGKV